MKTKAKKLLALFIALALCLAIAGCGSKEKDDLVDLGDDIETEVDVDANEAKGDNANANTDKKDSKNNTASNKNTAAAITNADSSSWADLLAKMPKTLKGTTITMFSWNPAKDVTGAEDVIKNFEKQTGIKVKWLQGNYDNYDSDIAAKINSGASPDIIRFNYPSPARMVLTQSVQDATGYDFKGDIWDKNVTSAYSIKGKIYGVNLKNTFNQQPMAVAYSMKTIDRYKLEDPYTLWKQGKWTLDKFKALCKDFKEQTDRAGWMTTRHVDPLWFSDIDLITFDGTTYKSNVKNAAVLQKLQDCCNNLSSGLTCEAASEPAHLEDGTYLFYTTSMLEGRRTDFHFPTLKQNDDLYFVPVPTGFSSKYIQNYTEYEAYGIPKGAKNPGAVYYFLRYYLNAENYDESMFFVNNQTLETYKYCISQPNVNYQTDRGVIKAISSDLGDIVGIPNFIRTGGKPDQVKSYIDKVSPTIDRAVNLANDTVKKIG